MVLRWMVVTGTSVLCIPSLYSVIPARQVDSHSSLAVLGRLLHNGLLTRQADQFTNLVILAAAVVVNCPDLYLL